MTLSLSTHQYLPVGKAEPTWTHAKNNQCIIFFANSQSANKKVHRHYYHHHRTATHFPSSLFVDSSTEPLLNSSHFCRFTVSPYQRRFTVSINTVSPFNQKITDNGRWCGHFERICECWKSPRFRFFVGIWEKQNTSSIRRRYVRFFKMSILMNMLMMLSLSLFSKQNSRICESKWMTPFLGIYMIITRDNLLTFHTSWSTQIPREKIAQRFLIRSFTAKKSICKVECIITTRSKRLERGILRD